MTKDPDGSAIAKFDYSLAICDYLFYSHHFKSLNLIDSDRKVEQKKYISPPDTHYIICRSFDSARPRVCRRDLRVNTVYMYALLDFVCI
jgi:hypothetical protein